jgi:hypothetical protein
MTSHIAVFMSLFTSLFGLRLPASTAVQIVSGAIGSTPAMSHISSYSALEETSPLCFPPPDRSWLMRGFLSVLAQHVCEHVRRKCRQSAAPFELQLGLRRLKERERHCRLQCGVIGTKSAHRVRGPLSHAPAKRQETNVRKSNEHAKNKPAGHPLKHYEHKHLTTEVEVKLWHALFKLSQKVARRDGAGSAGGQGHNSAASI